MALSMKEKYARVNVSKLPANYKAQYVALKEDTDNFDPDLVPIFQANFDKLYGLTEKNHPDAIKTGGTIKKVKSATVKKVSPKRKPEPKLKEITHKSRGKDKPTFKPKFKKGDEVYSFWNKKGVSSSKNKDDSHPIKTKGVIETYKWDAPRKTYSYNVNHSKGFYLTEEDTLTLVSSIKPLYEIHVAGKPKTALEIAKQNYSKFKDKKDITALNNALLSDESDYAKRDSDGNKIGGFKSGISDAITKTIKTEFINSKRRSPEIKELCVEIMEKMEYPDSSKTTKKPESKGGDHVDECRKVLSDAGYTYKKKLSKDGKKAMKHKAPRPERTIINEKVEDTFKTINKDISGSEDKDKKYKVMQGKLNEMQTLFNKLFNKLNNLAEDNETSKIDKIITTLKHLLD